MAINGFEPGWCSLIDFTLFPCIQHENGAYFIASCPKYFGIILNFLRRFCLIKRTSTIAILVFACMTLNMLIVYWVYKKCYPGCLTHQNLPNVNFNSKTRKHCVSPNLRFCLIKRTSTIAILVFACMTLNMLIVYWVYKKCYPGCLTHQNLPNVNFNSKTRKHCVSPNLRFCLIKGTSRTVQCRNHNARLDI